MIERYDDFCITMTLFITIWKKKTLAHTSFGWWWVLVLNDDFLLFFLLLAHRVDCFLCFSSLAQTSSRSSDSLARLYEMDDHPDRRVFLDKLLSFMEEKGTPITQCPTISKNPLDLFRLYLYTKERGGYLEVSKGAKCEVQASSQKKNRTTSFSYLSCSTLFVDLFVVCLFPVHKTENVEGHCGSIRHWSFLEWSLYVEEALRQKFTALWMLLRSWGSRSRPYLSSGD